MRYWLERGLSFFDRAFLLVAQVAIVLMMVTICTDSLGRYLFNRPLRGAYEVTSLYLMVVLVFMAMPATYASGGHIRLDLFRSSLARLPGMIPERLNALLAACAFGLVAWYAGGEAIDRFMQRRTTLGIIQFPLYWSYVWVPVGCTLLALRLALEVIFPQKPPAGDPGGAHLPAHEARGDDDTGQGRAGR
ncbi:MAG: TRAP transporter small permease [Pararhodobacter sp.]